MEYKIVQENLIIGLSNKVNEEIRKGWKPQGGVNFRRTEGFFQAMIKE
ncbi:DUF1737 domain-containing protein [Xanthomarina sp. F2636L]|nr:DUF1737 domain-containing protein [Xanthomarina sp. F2636L]MCX7550276.1 DUF1737 domain-containing protein [Xanthomarina sp. F2636L]